MRHKSKAFSPGLFLSLLMAAALGMSTLLPVGAQSETVYCGMQEHTHNESCYERVLVCDKLDEESSQIEAKQDENEDGTSAQEEAQPVHIHDDSCYETKLICTLAEHSHDLSCYANTSADVVSATELNAQVPSVQGSTAEKAEAIAKSFEGYTQSADNYIISESGDKQNYSKFGAYYNDAYANWNGYFASFVYEKAGASLGSAASTSAWMSDLSSKGLLKKEGAFEAGDLLFISGSDGLIAAIALSNDTAIAGDISGKVSTIPVTAISGYVSLAQKEDSSNEEAEQAAQEEEAEADTEAEKATPSKAKAAPILKAASTTDETTTTSDDTTTDSEDIDYETLAATAPSLTPYITKVSVYKSVDQVWEPVTSLVNGSSALIKISYLIPNDKISEDNRTYTYTLPDEISAEVGMTGTVQNDDRQDVGTFKVLAGGKVVLTFDKTYASDKAGFIGSLQFKGTVNEDNDKTHNITFPGSSTTISVTPHSNEPDLECEKTGEYESDGRIYYTVTVSSENGTGGQTVSIYDGISSTDGVTVSDLSSVSVVKVLADGQTETVTGYAHMAIPASTGSYLSGLPALSAGEHYVITYSVKTTLTQTQTDGTVTNQAQPTAGSTLSASATATTKVPQPMVDKSGSVDTINKVIDWKVVINRSMENIDGSVLNDDLPDGMEIVPGSKIVITNPAGTVVQTATSFPITIQDSSAEPLTVTYETTFGNVQKGQSTTNTATLTYNMQDYNGSGTVTMPDYGYAIKKSFDKVVSIEDNIVTNQWSISSYLNPGQTSYQIKDIIADVYNNTAGAAIANSHYTTIASLTSCLESSLQLSIATSSTTSETIGWTNDAGVTFSLTCYNANGDIVTDTSAQVASFDINITSDKAIEAEYLSATYDTFANDNLTPSGANVTVNNTASYNGESSTATTNYTKPGALSKYVKAGSNGTWSDGDSTVTYDETDGMLYYKILIPVNSDGTMVVTDTLSSDLTVEDLYPAVLYDSGEDQNSEVLQDAAVNIFPLASVENGKTVITITINATAILQATTLPVTAEVTYAVPISEDPYWDNPLNLEKKYSNTVEAGTMKATVSTTVQKAMPDVAKMSSITNGKADSGYFDIEYKVVINPSAKELNDASDTLTVTDTLEGLPGTECELDLNSVKLYHYDANASDYLGTQLPDSSFSYTYDRAKSQIIAEVPNGMALVLVYKYKVANMRSGAGTLTNNVSVSGASSTSNGTSVQAVSASGTVERFELKLFKVQADNDNIRLPNVPFNVQQYDPTTGTWTTIITDLITNADGEIDCVGPDEQQKFATNTLLRFVETEYPDGYAAPEGEDQYTEFVICADGDLPSTVEADLLSEGVPQDLLNKATFLNVAGGHIIVKNALTTLTAQKNWVDEYGDALDADAIPATSVNFVLMQSTNADGSDATEVANSLRSANASNDWKVSWSNLAKTNEDGQTYYYFVKETTTSYKWTTTYINNNGASTGTVMVTNTLTNSFALPETGEKGEIPYYLCAALFVLLAAAAYLLSKKGKKTV